MIPLDILVPVSSPRKRPRRDPPVDNKNEDEERRRRLVSLVRPLTRYRLLSFLFSFIEKKKQQNKPRRPKNTRNSTTRSEAIPIRSSTATPTTLSGRRPPPSRTSFTNCTKETRPFLDGAEVHLRRRIRETRSNNSVSSSSSNSNSNTGAFTISFTATRDGRSSCWTLCAASTLTASRYASRPVRLFASK